MWLTAKNAPLWHFGYTHTGWGGMAHAWVGVVVLIIYKNSTILLLYNVTIWYIITLNVIINYILLYVSTATVVF